MGAKTRCEWVSAGDALVVAYHDEEWGVPVHDDGRLFEFMVLEGAQAGLSWTTVLRKRENYRKAFGGFDPAKVARYDEQKLERLLSDPGIIRNALKIRSAVQNAKSCLLIQKEFGSLDAYLWHFVHGGPIVNGWKAMDEIPAASAESNAMSKDLLKRGFRFVGPTICYAFMQATGLVNDHVTHCFRYQELIR